MLYVGWPSFNDQGKYLGPLPPHTDVVSMPVGRAPDGTFRTSSSAAWPPSMCKHLASLIIQAFLEALKAGDWGHEEAAGKDEEEDAGMDVMDEDEDKDKDGGDSGNNGDKGKNVLKDGGETSRRQITRRNWRTSDQAEQ